MSLPAVEPLSRADRKLISALRSRSGRERHGLYLLEGPRAIADALCRGVEFRWLVVGRKTEEQALTWAEEGRLPSKTRIVKAGEREIERLADTRAPQGMLAIGPIPDRRLDDLPEPGPVTLLVDGVQDPGNLGTLVRTFVAVGGQVAIVCQGSVDPYNPKALRGAAGTTFDLALAIGVDRREATDWCRDHEIDILALVAGAPSLFEASLPVDRIALGVGNEAAGLSPAIGQGATGVIGLPMAEGVDSLSVAVAGSIALYLLAHDLQSRRER
jgi:TrmH family RNA methyltransferase